MGKATLRVAPELLLESLLLLRGYGLCDARYDPLSGDLVLVVEHHSIRNEEGQPIPEVVPFYSTQDGRPKLERVEILPPVGS